MFKRKECSPLEQNIDALIKKMRDEKNEQS